MRTSIVALFAAAACVAGVSTAGHAATGSPFNPSTAQVAPASTRSAPDAATRHDPGSLQTASNGEWFQGGPRKP